jgi:RNA polymerase-binding transcription factor DksA
MTPTASGLTEQQVAHYRRRLERLIARLRPEVRHLEAEAWRGMEQPLAGVEVPGIDTDPPSQEEEEYLARVLWQNERETLAQAEEALTRIAAGTYGLCVHCGAPIGKERLDLLPHTPYCIDCARKAEAGELD